MVSVVVIEERGVLPEKLREPIGVELGHRILSGSLDVLRNLGVLVVAAARIALIGSLLLIRTFPRAVVMVDHVFILAFVVAVVFLLGRELVSASLKHIKDDVNGRHVDIARGGAVGSGDHVAKDRRRLRQSGDEQIGEDAHFIGLIAVALSFISGRRFALRGLAALGPAHGRAKEFVLGRESVGDGDEIFEKLNHINVHLRGSVLDAENERLQGKVLEDKNQRSGKVLGVGVGEFGLRGAELGRSRQSAFPRQLLGFAKLENALALLVREQQLKVLVELHHRAAQRHAAVVARLLATLA
mmetsp:Transcript_11183/g.35696  ORF Transcript_11183/g.35696 Transcript_11183/m.35696 type:complete len:299 (+) Transcript_11183:724-1620(+)